MLLTIDKTSAVPLYLQIRGGIVRGIATRELRAGDRLPSVRNLASQLGVNLHTVNKAYEQLAAEGFVLLLGRRGAFIADAASGLSQGLIREQLAGLFTEFVAADGSPEEFMLICRDVASSAAGQQASQSGEPAATRQPRPASPINPK